MVFFCWITETGVARRVWRGLSVGVLVAGFAVWIAASTLSTLVGTSIKGVAGMGQTAEEKQHRWIEATMWSLPKLETLRVIIPGLFGYRLDNYDTTPDHAGVIGAGWRKTRLSRRLKSSDRGKTAPRWRPSFICCRKKPVSCKETTRKRAKRWWTTLCNALPPRNA